MAEAATLTPPEIQPHVIARLHAELNAWSAEEGDRLDSVRYECLARRLVAAEYGRPDAVSWAQAWFDDLVKQDSEKLALLEASRRERQDHKEAFERRIRSQVLAGKSGNPHFQAFLDTLEDPSILYNEHGTFQGHLYLCWIGPVIGRIERMKNCPPQGADRATFLKDALRRIALEQRAQRLGGPITATQPEGTP